MFDCCRCDGILPSTISRVNPVSRHEDRGIPTVP